MLINDIERTSDYISKNRSSMSASHQKQLEDENFEKTKERDFLSGMMPEYRSLLSNEMQIFQKRRTEQSEDIMQRFTELQKSSA